MDHIIDRLGGPAAVARMVGVKPPSVIEWRRRGIPPDRCPSIERATEGQVCCESLRPDVPWHRIADPAWPWHAAGRPLIDISQAPKSAAADAPSAPPPSQPEAANAA